jgi:hypothetical protein
VRVCIISAILLAVVMAQALESVDPAFDRLATVDRFAFGPVGYAARISQGEKDYKVILSRPSAMADFERLFAVGNPQARLYALAGIRTLNDVRFKDLARPLRGSRQQVLTQSGCVGTYESFSDVLGRIDAGDYSQKK